MLDCSCSDLVHSLVDRSVLSCQNIHTNSCKRLLHCVASFKFPLILIKIWINPFSFCRGLSLLIFLHFFLFAFLFFYSSFDFFQSFSVHLCNLLVSVNRILFDLFVRIKLLLSLNFLLFPLESLNSLKLFLKWFLNIFDSSFLIVFVYLHYFVKPFFLFVFFKFAFELIINFPGSTVLLYSSDSCRLTVGMSDKLLDRYLCDEEIKTHHVVCRLRRNWLANWGLWNLLSL